MNKIKYAVIFLVLLLVISFVLLSFVGLSNLSTFNEEKIAWQQSKIKFNGEYTKTAETSITNREVYLNYDSDTLDNNTELKESSSIYYVDTDKDGLLDDFELQYDTDLLKANSVENTVKDGTKIYFSGNENFSETHVTEKNITLTESGVNVENVSPDDIALSLIVPETSQFIQEYTEKALYVKDLSKGAIISVETTCQDPYIMAIDQLLNVKNEVGFSKKDGKLVFTHSGKNLIYMIGEKNKLSILSDQDFLIIKSQIPLMKKVTIYEKSNKLFDKDLITIPGEIKTPQSLKLVSKKAGKIKSFILNNISNTFVGNIYGEAKVAKENYTTSRYELVKKLNSKTEINDFVEKNSFNIDNFSTSLERQNVGAGLTYLLTLHNKEIKSHGKYSWETKSTMGLSTEYNFNRDLSGYEPILKNHFGDYKFSTKLVERQDLETTINPDLQVLRFIEMYSNVFENNKKKYLLTNKYDISNIDIIKSNIDAGNLPVFGIKTNTGGIYLTGYKYEISEFSDNVLKVYVYDPNYKQNKLNGENISEQLVLYLIKQPICSIEAKGVKKIKYELNYSYDPFGLSEYQFNNIDNKDSELDIFVF